MVREIPSAEKKLSDAKEKISELENQISYILDRNSNSGYVIIIKNTKMLIKSTFLHCKMLITNTKRNRIC